MRFVSLFLLIGVVYSQYCSNLNAMISQNEGNRPCRYFDSVGIPTIGYIVLVIVFLILNLKIKLNFMYYVILYYHFKFSLWYKLNINI